MAYCSGLQNQRRSSIKGMPPVGSNPTASTDARASVIISRWPFIFQVGFFDQRTPAAVRVISERCSLVSVPARAFPPLRPSSAAASTLPSSDRISSASPVAILATVTAFPITLAGRSFALRSSGHVNIVSVNSGLLA